MLESSQLAALAFSALHDAKAADIKLIDVRCLTDITDQMIICHGTSDRHVRALTHQVTDILAQHDTRPASIEGEDTGEWVLIDYIDVLIHIMKRETREHYDLESLWDTRLTGDAEETEAQTA